MPAPRARPQQGLPSMRLPLIRHAPLGAGLGALLLFGAIAVVSGGGNRNLLAEATGWARLPYMLGRVFPRPRGAHAVLPRVRNRPADLADLRDRPHPCRGHFFGIRWALRRPPTFLLFLAVVLVTPMLVNLHGVRSSRPRHRSRRPRHARPPVQSVVRQMRKAETDRRGDRTVRPVVVAVSGGASRAGLWAARALAEVDAAAAAGDTGHLRGQFGLRRVARRRFLHDERCSARSRKAARCRRRTANRSTTPWSTRWP